MEKNNNGFFKVSHVFWEVTKELSVAVKLFIIYLLGKENYFGSTEFYLTDREIEEDLRVGRRSISRWRKRAKMIRFIDYTAGKYKGSATTYNVKGIKMALSKWESESKRIKMTPKAYQDDAKSVPKVVMKAYQNDPTNKNIIKEEIKEEVKEERDFLNYSKPNQNLKNGLVIEKTEPFLRNRSLEESIAAALGKHASKPMIKGVLRGMPQERWSAVRVFLSKTYPANGDSAYYEAEREMIRELQEVGDGR